MKIFLRQKIFLFFSFISFFSYSADYFWVGGGGNWSDVNHWATTSGGVIKHLVVPNPSDDVFFDENSGFTSANHTVTCNGTTQNCRNMTWSGAFNSSILSGISNNNLNIYGSLLLQANMSFDVRSIHFLSDNLGATIRTNGTAIGVSSGGTSTIRFEGNGSWDFLDDVTFGGSLGGAITFNKGTINTNGHLFRTYSFQSISALPRLLSLSSSEVIVRGGSFNAWSYTGTGSTLDVGTSFISFLGTGVHFKGDQGDNYNQLYFLTDGGSNYTIVLGGIVAKKIEFHGSASLEGDNIMDTLILYPSKSYLFQDGKVQTIRKLFQSVTPPCASMTQFNSKNTLNTASLFIDPSCEVDVQGVIIENISVTGLSPFVATNSFDVTNNSGITFISPSSKILYWVGGHGEWTDPNHWSENNDGLFPSSSGGCVPTPADDVFFNENSGFLTGGLYVALNALKNYCRNMTWSGALNTPTIGGTVNTLSVFGSLVLQSDMKFNVETTYFRSNELGQIIVSNGVVIGDGIPNKKGHFNFFGQGSWDFQDDMTFGAAAVITFQEGTINTNGHNVIAYSFQSNSSFSRNLNLSNSVITLQQYFTLLGSSIVLNAGTSHIIMAGTYTSTSQYFQSSDGLVYHNITYSSSSSTGGSMYGNNIIVNKIHFYGSCTFPTSIMVDSLLMASSHIYTLPAGSNVHIGKYWLANTATCEAMAEITSSSTTTAANIQILPGCVVDLNGILIQGINVISDTPLSANSCVDMGGNTGFVFPSVSSANTLYWVGGAGNWVDPLHWSLNNDGVFPSSSGGCVPSTFDNVVFNENSGFIAGSATVLLNGVKHYCNDMTWINAPNNPIISGTPLYLGGSLSLQPAMVYDITLTNLTSKVSGNTIKTNGIQLRPSNNCRFNLTGGGTWELLDDFYMAGTNGILDLTAGTLLTNGFNINIPTFNSTSSNARSLQLFDSEVTLRSGSSWNFYGSNHTLSAENSKIFFTASLNTAGLHGGIGDRYGQIHFLNEASSNAMIQGGISARSINFRSHGRFTGDNTADTLVFSAGKVYSIASGSTQTISNAFYPSGNPCFPTEIRSVTSGSQGKIDVLSGNIGYNYCNIKDINASGSYTNWSMAAQSYDGGNVLGIDFAPVDPLAGIVGLGPDRTNFACVFDTLLTTEDFYPNPNTTFLWSDGSTGSSLRVTKAGTYKVTVTYAGGCVISDSVKISSIEETVPPIIHDCPTGITVNTSVGLTTGIATWPLVTATDNCQMDSLVSNYESGDVFNMGVTVVTYRAYDVNKNMSSCSFDVVVVDAEAPIVHYCPSDTVVYLPFDACSVDVSWRVPEVSDNHTAIPDIVISVDYPSGSTFGVGITTVTYTFKDSTGNVSYCSFEVDVVDNTAPTIVGCSPVLDFSPSVESCGAFVSWVEPTATDNCDGIVLYSSRSHAPNSLFPIGNTTVVYVFTDGASNSSTCSFTVFVEDIAPPIVQLCPLNIVVDQEPNTCSAIVSWIPPTAIDLCSGIVTDITVSHAPNTSFPVGITEVTYVFKDDAENVAICQFSITVRDITLPSFGTTCPPNVSVVTSASTCTGPATWIEPIVSDICGNVNLTSDYASGDVFNLGSTTVTYTAVDDSGNEATCAFGVTVVDDIAPIIADCPSTITRNQDSDLCSTEVTWVEPTATDNCTSSGLLVNRSHAPGSRFNVGTTNVSYTYEDGAGNESFCSFNVIVRDTIPPSFGTSCPSNISVSTEALSCSALVSWTSPIATDVCGTAYMSSDYEPNSSFNIGVTTVTYTAVDVNDLTALCVFTVTVIDDVAPVISGCPSTITVDQDPIVCSASVSWTEPTAVDNCEGNLSYFTRSNIPSSDFPVGSTTVTYVFKDDSDNESTCVFDIIVEDNIPPSFGTSCPSDINSSANATCQAVVNWSVPVATDVCGVSSLTSDYDSGDVFNLGSTTVTYTAIDDSGNEATCTFVVTVVDDIAPIIADCPQDVSVTNDLGLCGAVVSWSSPTAVDGCGGIIELISSHVSGTLFNIGSTVVTYSATDVSGNVANCLFEIEITDTESPTISVSDISTQVCIGEQVFWNEVVTDNCEIASIVYTIDNGSVLSLGVHLITITAMDIYGNTADYDFSVTVNELPLIELVDDIAVCLGESVIFSVKEPNQAYKYEWVHNGFVLYSGHHLELTSIQLQDSGVYTVVAENSYGCSAISEARLIITDCEIFIPESFSPNGDGVNDLFVIPILSNYPNSKIWINNRWGVQVYQSDNYQNDWSGFSASSITVGDEALPEGTYYYILQLGGDQNQNRSGDVYKGFVYLKP